VVIPHITLQFLLVLSSFPGSIRKLFMLYREEFDIPWRKFSMAMKNIRKKKVNS